ncbi:alpha/beta hydrolase, partial [Alcaligenes pakistanensis]
DLEPLTYIGINEALQLNADTARASSPLFWPAPANGQPFEAWVGGDESSEFHRQSQELAQSWSRQGLDAVYRSLPGTNHYNVIAALADKESVLSERLLALASN